MSMETILTGLKTVLQADLTAALTTVSSQFPSSAITLDSVPNARYKIANSEELGLLEDFPYIILFGLREEPIVDFEQGFEAMYDAYHIGVRLLLKDTDAETLDLKAFRYALAMKQVIRNNRTLNTTCQDLDSLAVDYSTVTPTSPLFQAVEVSFRALKVTGVS